MRLRVGLLPKTKVDLQPTAVGDPDSQVFHNIKKLEYRSWAQKRALTLTRSN